jgi:hypothetical protein
MPFSDCRISKTVAEHRCRSRDRMTGNGRSSCRPKPPSPFRQWRLHHSSSPARSRRHSKSSCSTDRHNRNRRRACYHRRRRRPTLVRTRYHRLSNPSHSASHCAIRHPNCRRAIRWPMRLCRRSRGRRAALIDAYETINPEGHGFSSWLDEYRGNATADSRNVCSYVYTLLHTMAHQMMHSVARVSGLELGSLAEHIFLPDLAFVVYRRGTTMDLGYLSSAWRMATNFASGNLILSSMLDPTSRRCGSGALCDERGGACPDCILIPEVCCLTRNNLLSRSVLRGMSKPHWDVVMRGDESLTGYFEAVRNVRQARSTQEAAE